MVLWFQEDVYALMYTNSSWYLFIRLYHMFCKRLEEIRQLADSLLPVENEKQSKPFLFYQ